MRWTTENASTHLALLPANLHEAWLLVANAATANTANDDGAGLATTTINQLRKIEVVSEARYIIDEVGKKISAASGKNLQSAIDALKSALEAIAPLLTDDADEPVTESGNPLTDIEVDPVTAPSRQLRWHQALVAVDEAGKILAQKDSYSNKRYAIDAALRNRAVMAKLTSVVNDGNYDMYYDYDYGSIPSIRDLYDDYVIYCKSGVLFQCTYSVGDGGVVTLGDETEVQVSYVPVVSEGVTSESLSKVDIQSDLIPLIESRTTDSGDVLIKVISPGWGSSGYYSEQLLKKFANKFHNGMHMYLDHPTDEEERNRPERTVKDLVGVLKEDAKWSATGANGPGLYAKATVFQAYRPFIDEAGPHIGVSIRASGTAHDGEAEGRHGRIIDTLEDGFSVDYVTMAGRGGQVLPLAEAARARVTIVENTTLPITQATQIIVEETQEFELDEKEFNALKESLATTQASLLESQNELARLHEANLLREARDIVSVRVSAAKLPDITKARLMERFPGLINPPVDGKVLDRAKLVEAIDAAILEETSYIETIGATGTGGRPIGLGTELVTEATDEELDAGLASAFKEFGLSEAGVKIAVKGRN